MSSDDKPRTHLRLAVENDQKDIDREWAKQDVGRPLRELAANIIRIVRGAGKSYEIASQCVSVIEAFQRYRDKVGHWPTNWEIDQALSIREDDENASYDDAWERENARETILRGALQVAASRLVGQNTQEQRGRSELMDGVNSIERLREEARKRLAEAERARRQASKPKLAARKNPARFRPAAIRLILNFRVRLFSETNSRTFAVLGDEYDAGRFKGDTDGGYGVRPTAKFAV